MHANFDISNIDIRSLSPTERSVLAQYCIRRVHAERDQMIRAMVVRLLVWVRAQLPSKLIHPKRRLVSRTVVGDRLPAVLFYSLRS